LVSATHWTHLPLSLHCGAVGELHWVVVRHSTHVEVAVLQTGAAAGHCPLFVQPGRQVKSPGSQIGAADPQSAFEVHETQRPRPTRHRGVLPEQSAFERHWTQRAVAPSHTCAFVGQSLVWLHPTQSPVGALQIGASFGHACAPVHCAWHW
jgi:hypothetical protein